MEPQAGEITELLTKWKEGDSAALERLCRLVHRDLHLIARRHLKREDGNCTIQPSSLVQETFLRLLPNHAAEWQGRVHFFAAASRVMRHVLVDYARERRRLKRGALAEHIPLDAAVVLSPDQIDETIAIDLALERLAAFDQRKSSVFEMRFFGGLTLQDTAEALGVSLTTVARDWDFARAWLRRELKEASLDGASRTN